MISGKPVKIFVVDTQVYSNTGGQACTSGFYGQVSDMAQYGKAIKGKEEVRKEIGLVGMAHRTTYVMQSTMAHPSHMIEGFVQGLMARRPALFNMYTSCQPEHGIGDDMAQYQAKLAVESRAYPLFRYDPDAGKTPDECFDLEMNPAIEDDWPTYELKYEENGREKSMEIPMTFADFAVTEARFRKHFRIAPPDTWNENMVPLHEFLQMEKDDREGLFPYIWWVDRKKRLTRVLVAEPLVISTQERLDFWIMLKGLAGADKEEAPAADLDRIRTEIVQKIAGSLLQMAGGEGSVALAGLVAEGVAPAAAPAVEGDYMAPWIDTDQCTACDECTNINKKIFVYNDQKKAVIKDPKGGPYKDIVKSAEKCTARIIHPGLPADRSAKDIDKWIKRGEKFN
jgi:pyruvate-ferredoxin/flavodoxin oxidoreductase